MDLRLHMERRVYLGKGVFQVAACWQGKRGADLFEVYGALPLP